MIASPPTTLVNQTLDALVRHRILTASQLRELLTPGAVALTNTYARLGRLRRAGLARPLPASRQYAPKPWCATAAGLDAAGRGPAAPRRYVVPAAGTTLVAHTLAVNEVGLAFVRAARQAGHDCDERSWEHEVAHPLTATRRPRDRHHALVVDAVLAYTIPAAVGGEATVLARFVELDRATEPVPALVTKLHRYAAYRTWVPPQPGRWGLASGEAAWRARYHRWPVLLIVVGANRRRDEAACRRRIDAVFALASADPLLRREPLPVLATTLERLRAEGPFAAIWRRPDAPHLKFDVVGRSA